MPATEMQEMEMDMVQGMYDTFTLHTLDPPTYSVLLAPTAEDAPELRVTVVYDSPNYPETAAPVVRLEHTAKHRRMQTAPLAKDIAELCAEQIGMHSVIAALQQAQEGLSAYAQSEERAELQRRGEAMALAAAAERPVAADPTVRIGTAVTRELFADWSKRRQAEKRAARDGAERERKVTTKLTGRQLWDSTLKHADWELFGGEADGQDVDFAQFDPEEEEEEESAYDFD